MVKKIVFPLLFSFVALLLQAREGMWIPLLQDQNIEEMHQMGCKLNAGDIYSTSHPSMKDAIVHFGRGCTGELISPEGLLVTNYHCGYTQIQSHSSVENDYLTNGFWAMNRGEELPNPGLTVTFLIDMEDVTDSVLAGTDTIATLTGKESLINKKMSAIIIDQEEKTGYDATIKPFYEGNRYYLLLTQTYSDVRLVGAPPSAIGKFGGDTDNWMWPRHTGDFSLFRIYADKDNKPADYSPDNVPYHPKSYFPIKISGINKGDFTMVFGYPGTTQEYLPSAAIEMIMNQSDPDCISIRDLKLKILSSFMDNNPETRIKYSAKYASTSNAWKKWQGEVTGLKRLNTIDEKKNFEKEFTRWTNQNEQFSREYGKIIPRFEELYSQVAPFQKAYDYYTECIYRGFDVYKNYLLVSSLLSSKNKTNTSSLSTLRTFFKDYSPEVDYELFIQLISKYYHDLPDEFQSPELKKIFRNKNYEGKFKQMYSKSRLTSKAVLTNALKDSTAKQLNKVACDPLYRLLDSITRFYNNHVRNSYFSLYDKIDETQEKYMKAILEKNKDKMLYPDANSTMRVSYGKVEGFSPKDGITYNYYTTLSGVIEKDAPDIYDYKVPEKLKKLYREKDFGRYCLPDSTLPVCFTATNHTTGGNSGSPVIDAEGNLIGINFDRCWEGTMSDLEFDPEKCRNISLDVRYFLFLVDKFAGAGYLLNEMKIVN